MAVTTSYVAFWHVEVRLGRATDAADEEGIRTLVVVDRVAANGELRRWLDTLCQGRGSPWEMLVPPPLLCTDQGVMSAWAAVERLMVGSSDPAEDQVVFARYPFSLSSDNDVS